MRFVSRMRESGGNAEYMIDFRDLLRVLVRNIFLIVLAAEIFAFAGFWYGTNRLLPTYETTFTACVYNVNSQYDVTSLNSSDTEASQILAKSYAKVMLSRSVINDVMDQAGMALRYEDLYGCLSCEVEEDTPIITVSVSMTDPYDVYLAADALAQYLPGVMESTLPGSYLEITDLPAMPVIKSGPSITKLVLIGGVLGGFLSAVLICVLSLMNQKVTSPEEVEEAFGYKVIGTLPE